MSLRYRLALYLGANRAIKPVCAIELTGMRLTPAPVSHTLASPFFTWTEQLIECHVPPAPPAPPLEPVALA